MARNGCPRLSGSREVALADRDPEKVRRIVAALERSIAKLNAWLAEHEQGGPDTPE
jgi:hypothetical protein